MSKINKHIEIVRTTNSPFSSMGLKSCDMIQSVLSDYYEVVGVTTVDNMNDLELLVLKSPDLVFLGLKRLPFDSNSHVLAQNVWMSEYLQDSGINYTGSTKAAIAMDFDKENAKLRVQQAGLPTAEIFTTLPGRHKSAADLPVDFPLFVKPLDTGGGKGVGGDSVVYTFKEFEAKVESIFIEFGSRSMVESYLTGREFSVAILDSGTSDGLKVMPVELITDKDSDGHMILGRQVKGDDVERVIAVSDEAVRESVTSLAKDVYRALGARDLGRIDIRMDNNGKAYFLEANLVPGLADNEFVSYFNRACMINEGMEYTDILLKIVGLGLARN
ncbi:MAG: D-alanine--D-alanine ligase [Candidatus Saccharibacteria bacterium]